MTIALFLIGDFYYVILLRKKLYFVFLSLNDIKVLDRKRKTLNNKRKGFIVNSRRSAMSNFLRTFLLVKIQLHITNLIINKMLWRMGGGFKMCLGVKNKH